MFFFTRAKYVIILIFQYGTTIEEAKNCSNADNLGLIKIGKSFFIKVREDACKLDQIFNLTTAIGYLLAYHYVLHCNYN